MRFKYISHLDDGFRLRTVTARDEEDAWELVEELTTPPESGFLIPIKEWKNLMQRDRKQGRRNVARE